MNPDKRTIDAASREMLEEAGRLQKDTAWDRYEMMQPQCGFGQLGSCCRICNMGPCRIDPFGEGPQNGVCGANADTIVARNLLRMVAAGAAAHSDHGRDVAHTLLLAAEGKGEGYKVKDPTKLREIAHLYGLAVDGKDEKGMARELALKALEEFGQIEGTLHFLNRAPQKTRQRWQRHNLLPRSIDREVVECMHRTTMGVDNDYKNILMHGFRTALADGWGGSMIATELSDILFGSPTPLKAKVNLGALRPDCVNVVVHGHEPTLSDVVVDASRDPQLVKLAKDKGAEGINIVGICCTANEILMRRGIPIAGNFLQQELALLTGAVDLMMVDVQCVMPALSELASCFHTVLVTTSAKAKFSGVRHIQFEEKRALSIAKEILQLAIENFPNRSQSCAKIPQEQMDLIAGFTAEDIPLILGGKYHTTWRPVNDAIISGRLRGIAGVVGCNNPNIQHDFGHIAMVKELIKNDILVVSTGCSAIASAKAGLLHPESAFKFAGKGLQEICAAVGVPPVLHAGACVDNSRILIACCRLIEEGGLGEELSQLPVAGAAPEWMSEKAVTIGFYFVASGVFTVFGTPQPVLGSSKVTQFLCQDTEEILGGKFAFEPDPIKASRLMMGHINKKRQELGLKAVMYEGHEVGV